MKTYNVKKIAETLRTNPETVRRRIRDKKLDTTIESKKDGHIVYETALRKFPNPSPKYVCFHRKASLAGTAVGGAVLLTVIIEGNQHVVEFFRAAFHQYAWL